MTSIMPPHTVIGNSSMATDKNNFKDSMFDDLYDKALIGKKRLPAPD